MHLVAVDVHLLQRTGNLFHLLLLAREDDDALQVALLEDVVDNLQFLRVVADIGTLADFLCRLGDGNLHLYRLVKHGDCQLSDLRRHRGREHDALARTGQLLDYLHDIVDEAHVEHAVGLVEDEETAAREVEVADFQMTEQTAGRGNEHIGAKPHATEFLFVSATVVTTIDSHRRYSIKIIAEALHGLVYLLGEFTGRGHHHTVDGILRVVAVVEHREDR